MSRCTMPECYPAEERHEPSAEPHGCPFQSDVHNDSEFECYCCEDCERECLYDI